MTNHAPTPTSSDRISRQFISIQFQKGAVNAVGLNGCRIEDVMDVLVEQLQQYQSGPVACIENEESLHHLALAKLAQLRRRQLREEQGVINTQAPHQSLFKHRTEDEVADFSATGS